MRNMLKRLRFPIVAATAIALSGLSTDLAAASPALYPIDWSPVGAARQLLADPAAVMSDAVPMGANDWNCKPVAEHPNPVILLSGINVGPGLNFARLSPLLKNNGYCVFTLTYGVGGALGLPGFVDMRVVAATELAPFVDKVLAATGAAKADFLGHSEGTVMPRWYLNKLGGDRKIGASVNLAPMWQGTTLYGIGQSPAVGALNQLVPNGHQFLPGSDYLNEVNAGAPFPGTVRFTSIVSIHDEEVVPYSSGIAPPGPNVSNVVIQDACPTNLSTHDLMAVDPVTAQYVLNALDPARAAPIDCAGVPRNSG